MKVAGKIDISSSKHVKEDYLLLGEDWETPEASVDSTTSEGGARRCLIPLNRLSLARRIIVFNRSALTVRVAGVLFLNPFRHGLVVQCDRAFVTEPRLVANVVSALQTAEGKLQSSLGGVSVGPRLEVFLFDPSGALVAQTIGQARPGIAPEQSRSTVTTDLLNAIWSGGAAIISGNRRQNRHYTAALLARGLFVRALSGNINAVTGKDAECRVIFSVATPVVQGTTVLGVVAFASAQCEIDLLALYQREQILQMFAIALLVSVGLRLVLASAIASPLSDLAAASDLARNRHARKITPDRIRIPDFAPLSYETGHLSVAIGGVVAEIYDQIDVNAQFAADVNHETKSPLASPRSAVGLFRMVKKEENCEKLLDVIEHDVRRFDRLVSGISNAISFCEDGDVVRVCIRSHENRVLIVDDNTGSGISDQAVKTMFKRFYPYRSINHFRHNSGLSLSASKQIAKAHGGVLSAQKIRPTKADPTSDPLAARFVVGLPV